MQSMYRLDQSQLRLQGIAHSVKHLQAGLAVRVWSSHIVLSHSI